MENKKLSLEDRIKPYLIFAKALQHQVFQMKQRNPEEDVLAKEELINIVLNQMLKQVKYKDIIKEDYFDLASTIDKEFGMSYFEEFDKEIDSQKLSLSTLIGSIKIKSLDEMKSILKDVENKL